MNSQKINSLFGAVTLTETGGKVSIEYQPSCLGKLANLNKYEACVVASPDRSIFSRCTDLFLLNPFKLSGYSKEYCERLWDNKPVFENIIDSIDRAKETLNIKKWGGFANIAYPLAPLALLSMGLLYMFPGRDITDLELMLGLAELLLLSIGLYNEKIYCSNKLHAMTRGNRPLFG